MKTINLRDYYPHYKEDEYYEVPDAIAELLDEFERREEAYRIYTLRYKAYYSLEADDGIEKSFLLSAPSPDEIMEQQRIRVQIFRGLDKLPEIQRRRVFAYYFLGMRLSEIARVEHRNKKTISESIDAGVANLNKFFEKIF